MRSILRPSNDRQQNLPLPRQHSNLSRVGAAVKEVAQRLRPLPSVVVLAGSGEFLGRLVLQKLADFTDQLVTRFERQFGNGDAVA